MLLTVIIPTYKRLQTLLGALQSLQEQSLPDFEILVVDNAVDPAVEQRVNAFNETARFPAIYIPEPRLGVHYARNRAAQLASGELLLFTDDDMTFNPRWAEAYAESFRDHPEMSAAGGPVRPHWEQPPPKWLLDYIGASDSFGILSFMEPYHAFTLNEKVYFYSCNMAIRKSKLIERDGFHPEATGDVWVGDGETGLHRDMQAKGDLIGYVPDALTYHHIPPSRMTPAYFCKRMANQGASQIYAKFYGGGIPGYVKLSLMIIKRILVGLPVYIMAAFLRDSTDCFSLNTQMESARLLSEITYIYKIMHSSDFRKMVLRRNWINNVE